MRKKEQKIETVSFSRKLPSNISMGSEYQVENFNWSTDANFF